MPPYLLARRFAANLVIGLPIALMAGCASPDRRGWEEQSVALWGREGPPASCGHRPNARTVYEQTLLLAVIPPTEAAQASLAVCSGVMKSPMLEEADVPTLPAYFDAVAACMHARGIVLERTSLRIRPGRSDCISY